MTSKLKQGLSALFSTLPTIEKFLHAIVLLGVVWQLLSSAFMHVHGDTLQQNISAMSFLHIYGGLILLPWALVFVLKVLIRRQLADLYPWLSGRFDVIKQDVESIINLDMPETRPAGLAACIEGLGLLALLLALATGGGWYWFLNMYGPNELLLSIHKLSVTFIQIYFFGHGAAAVLHLIVWWRGQPIK